MDFTTEVVILAFLILIYILCFGILLFYCYRTCTADLAPIEQGNRVEMNQLQRSFSQEHIYEEINDEPFYYTLNETEFTKCSCEGACNCSV